MPLPLRHTPLITMLRDTPLSLLYAYATDAEHTDTLLTPLLLRYSCYWR